MPDFFHGRDIDNFVLVYTMGKVGSTALARSLDAVGLFARHLQWMTPESQAFFDRMEAVTSISDFELMHNLQNRLNARRAYHALRDPEYASLIKVITAVRAPIEQILSHYFQGIAVIERALRRRGRSVNPDSVRDDLKQSVDFYLARSKQNIKDLTRDVSAENYERIWFCWLVHNQEHWIDEEFLPFFRAEILGGDLREGFQLAGNALIVRFESFGAGLEQIIASYVQRPQFKLLRENVGADKDYGTLYREVADTIKLPKEFVNRICEFKYVRHFYSDKERQAMRARWL